MEVDACLMCDICRVAYSTDQELQEHNWSLMHHIKIEKTKKPADPVLNERGGNMPQVHDRHTRSYSQPVQALEVDSTVQRQDNFKHPADFGGKPGRQRGRKKKQEHKHWNRFVWNESGNNEFADNQRVNEGRWNSMQELGQDMYQGQNGETFYDDNYGTDWNDNKFFSYQDHGHNGWNENQNWGRHKRRGSFDESFEYQNRSGHERPGRTSVRGRQHKRTSSYDPHRSVSNEDRYSPESNSSTDSNGLKRRLEGSDFGAPEKSRRKEFRFRRYNDNQGDRVDSFPEKNNEMRTRSRSASREKLSHSRSHSQNSTGRRVTWSDQQEVSSTTDLETFKSDVGKPSCVSKPAKKDFAADLPDSTPGVKKKKKKGKGNGGKNMIKLPGTSNIGRSKPSQSSDDKPIFKSSEKDSTESVLEKAEKLCKKLRNDREKVKQQKLEKEKQKKFEKTEELNSQIAELSKENKKKITGQLDSIEQIQLSDNNILFSPEASLSESSSQGKDSQLKPSSALGLNLERLNAKSLLLKSPVVKPATPTTLSGDPKMAERIAQTRADIDAIRAKIEGSVQADKSKPALMSPPFNMSPLSSCKKQPDNNSLLKMVNSPRTTRERLHIAEMLRNHAKSQSKLSLPRFNLKMSDMVENQTEIEGLSEYSLETLAPSVQLEIANLIEADIKPDVNELQLLLDSASAQNTELDGNILSDLGILQTSMKSVLPAQDDVSPKPGTPSSRLRQRTLSADANIKFLTPERDGGKISELERCKSPVSARKTNGPQKDVEVMDERPSLSVEELVTEVNKAKEHLLGVREREKMEALSNTPGRGITDTRSSPSRSFSSSLPIPASDMQNVTNLSSSVHKTCDRFDNVKVKVEVEDGGYDLALSAGEAHHRYKSQASTPSTGLPSSDSKTNGEFGLSYMGDVTGPSQKRSNNNNRDSGLSVSGGTTPAVTGVHRSHHTKFLYADEMPVRDTDRHSPTTAKDQSDSTVDRVNAILNAVPNLDNVLTPGQLSSRQKQLSRQDKPEATTGPRQDKPEATTGPQKPVEEKDKQLDSSVNSNTSSILDQVYSICVEEESVRSEISTVDAKIDKLKSLIDEAQVQLNTFTEQRKELTSKEGQFRTSRMRLLQENRSLQGSSGSQSAGSHHGPMHPLSEAQIQNLSNPMLVKFLMSQRQSDLSSVGGYSNVESGSQPDDGQHSERRGSASSVASGHLEPARSMSEAPQRHSNLLFTQSIDILSGSTDTLTSLHSEKPTESPGRDSGTPIPSDGAGKKDVEQSQENQTSPNSFSFMKHRMDNFVTLEALMNGDAEIGKLIHKSLESIQKGDMKQEEEVVIKTPESTGAKGVGVDVRGRRESGMSVGSDDMCVSGSDTEKRAGKVSMKYMGTLPKGLNYDSIVKQISSGGKNKPVMFTVLSSPEPMGTGKPSFDANVVSALGTGNSPDIKPFVTDFGLACDKSPRSDTTSNLSLDLNEGSVSARSNFSLGEQIKRMCDGHTADDGEKNNLDIVTPRSESSGEKTLEDESNKHGDVIDERIKDCSVTLERIDPKFNLPKSVSPDLNSPIRKRLKSKRERDQMSRRKQKETFILVSDTNSDDEMGSQNSSLLKASTKGTSISEEDLVLTGSEDARTPRHGTGPNQTALTKKSLLDEVQLETETLSESGEDRPNRSKQNRSPVQRLHLNLKNGDKKKSVKETSGAEALVDYTGPTLSVAAIQLFKGEVFVCYNGSELRRFELKTGRILKELDCSPNLVNCLHVTSVEERGDILYTAGACKKLMLFNPKSFSLISTLTYFERITSLHENWGRLFVGLSDGSVSVRSLKTDKELNSFFLTTSSIHCVASASAGMTKMICLGTGDNIIYILDAITGLLITMLEGHTQPPLCIQVMGENVISGSTDHTILVHNVSSGQLLKTVRTNVPLSQLWTDGSNIYAASHDQVIRVYDHDLKLSKSLMTKGIVTCGMFGNSWLFTGYRSGMVEAMTLSSKQSGTT